MQVSHSAQWVNGQYQNINDEVSHLKYPHYNTVFIILIKFIQLLLKVAKFQIHEGFKYCLYLHIYVSMVYFVKLFPSLASQLKIKSVCPCKAGRFVNSDSQNCPVPLFTDNIQHTVATGSECVRERVRGEKNSAWLYEELLRVWSLPDKGMKALQLP